MTKKERMANRIINEHGLGSYEEFTEGLNEADRLDCWREYMGIIQNGRFLVNAFHTEWVPGDYKNIKKDYPAEGCNGLIVSADVQMYQEFLKKGEVRSIQIDLGKMYSVMEERSLRINQC